MTTHDPVNHPAQKPRAPKVGDTVTTEAEYAALPPGSIVAIDGNATALGKFKNGQWGAGMDYACDCDYMAGTRCTVLRVGWRA